MEVRDHRTELIGRTRAAVQERLTKEINYWDHRAQQLRLEESAGRTNARLNSDMAQHRADDLQARLQNRLRELDLEAQLAPLPPGVLGGAIIAPASRLRLPAAPNASAAQAGEVAAAFRETPPEQARDAEARRRVELLAMRAVMAPERALRFEPTDVRADHRGYDVESRIPNTGKLRFLEVKGLAVGAHTVTITRDEIMTALNKPEDFILAIVTVDLSAGQAGGDAADPRHARKPFQREPDFAVTSVNYELAGLLNRSIPPT